MAKLFRTVMVANRGEIAVRILRTLRSMNIESVAVYTDADDTARHVLDADRAEYVGGDMPSGYLDIDAIVAAAVRSGAQAVHPGYGFLSERAEFAAACSAAGIVFIGPSVDDLLRFGQKHTARELASAASVPLLAGTGLIEDRDAACIAAAGIGYPVMLKASAGGGGIGMRRCNDEVELREAFDVVEGLAARNFGGGGVFLERFVARARHVEVQIFGDGTEVVALGDRDCSAQRRNQKVVEEAPAPDLGADLRTALHDAAIRLARSVGYRSAGTVEFVVDADRDEFAFLEVNTRLQVEHPVTEAVWGIDLVEWMVRESAGVLDALPDLVAACRPAGVAIEARVYAEDPCSDFQPATGQLTAVDFPDGARIDSWVEAGSEISPFFDPMIAKVIVHGTDRSDAVERLRDVLARSRVDGVCTNIDYLRDVVATDGFAAGGYSTGFLSTVTHVPRRVDVLDGGMQTTVQDAPGRVGYWAVGVPPSGPMDDRSLRRANALVSNPLDAAGLECTRVGPTLRFVAPATIALTGAPMAAELDGRPAPFDTPIEVGAGSVLRLGSVTGAGARTYVAVSGGLDVPQYLGARSTFMLGGFGGHAGRALRTGDVLPIGGAVDSSGPAAIEDATDADDGFTSAWTIGVLDGPHGAPDFFTPADIDMLYATKWEVHHQSDRTGVRLVGPAPQWARSDGGEAGLHPSNIHDNAYAIGTIDFTGDMPVILGPDGPSLGGFVCPVTIVRSERWKMGQLSPGDTVQFVRHGSSAERLDPVVQVVPESGDRPAVTMRRAGDEYALVEFGPNVLDLELRARVHALQDALAHGAVDGIEEMVPGIRSLQLRVAPHRSVAAVLADVAKVEAGLPDAADLVVPSRVVHLPLSWADPSTQVAVDRYMQSVRDDAPWCPNNLEFIRRINGLDSIDDVRRIVFDATYLVLGLGDVYLGAPVATPLDPRHRLVTTKYNPARTWTPQNAVGIGGAYMCVYGMEGPGGYQFVGRTIQMWNSFGRTPEFPGPERWLLRWFDQIRFHPVSADELSALRRDFAAGRHRVEIENTTLALRDHRALLSEHRDTIERARSRQRTAFDEERRRWVDNGEFDRVRSLLQASVENSTVDNGGDLPLAEGVIGISSPVHGMVQRVPEVGTTIGAGDAVVVVEAMKTETGVPSPCDATVVDVRCEPGDMVVPGRVLVGLEPV